MAIPKPFRGIDIFGRSTVSRNNTLYLIVGALAVAVAVLGYQLYQDRHQPEGLHINVGPNGLSVQGK
jgi:RsiW-degrading membrane proteinase PrsW (M82 family)